MRYFIPFLLLFAPVAMAETTAYRVEPEWVAILGGEISETYTDNVFSAPANTQDDLVSAVSPVFRLKGDLNRMLVELQADAEEALHASHAENDHLDARAGFKISSRPGATMLKLRGSYGYEHVAIGTFDDDPERLAAEPTPYRKGIAGFGIAHGIAGWRTTFDAAATHLDYDNVNRRNFTRLINDDRDRMEYEGGMRLGYAVTEVLTPYIEGTLNRRDYTHRIDGTAAFPRDSQGYGILTGSEWKQGGVTLDGALGFLAQDYDAANLEDVHAPTMHAALGWQADAFLLTARLAREVCETTLAGNSSYLRTRGELGAEYFFHERWTGTALLGLALHDFQNAPTTPERKDTVLDAGLGVEYTLSEDYAAGMRYAYASRESDDLAVEYGANSVMVYFGVKY